MRYLQEILYQTYAWSNQNSGVEGNALRFRAARHAAAFSTYADGMLRITLSHRMKSSALGVAAACLEIHRNAHLVAGTCVIAR